MSVFEHNHLCDPKDSSDNPEQRQCAYCNSNLKTVDVEDFWGEVDNNRLMEIHQETIIAYKEWHNLEDCYLNLNLGTKDEEVWLNYCETCGWWRLIKDVCICAEEWQIWDIYFGVSGNLKSLDLNDLKQPIDEVSNYLIAKYDSRFSIHPRLFEQVVASVFKNIGYSVYVTGYSNDGGIDVVLGKEKEIQTGVQVKRYKDKIKVEQIRAFAGALMLSDLKKGIFVTISDFQPAALKASKSFTSKTLPIELINANQFYQALKISQKPSVHLDRIKDILKKRSDLLFYYGCDTHRNSL